MIKKIYSLSPNAAFNYFLKLALPASFLMFQSYASAAAIKSTSLEIFRDSQTPFWEVSISCEGASEPRIMMKLINGTQWCSTDITTLCNENKFSLSQQLCDNEFFQRVSDFKNGEPLKSSVNNTQSQGDKKAVEQIHQTPKVGIKENKSTVSNQNSPVSALSAQDEIDRDSLLKEKMQIEEQRILIQQKRLELRRLELSLKKQQLSSS